MPPRADSHGGIVASVTSSTHERKSKTNIVTKHGRLLLKHNAFTCAGWVGGQLAGPTCLTAHPPSVGRRALRSGDVDSVAATPAPGLQSGASSDHDLPAFLTVLTHPPTRSAARTST